MGFLIFMLYIGIFMGLLILWKRVYFKPLAAICVTSGSSSLVSVKPSFAWLKSVKSSNSTFVGLGDGYVAYQCEIGEALHQNFSDSFQVDPYIYIFRVRFGRLRSVVLSDRKLSDLIKKFKKVV